MATILVVDDHEENRYYLSRLLRHGGHRALEAENGIEALRIAHMEQPDLIITDILMPRMDGYEFVHKLRQDESCARTPVVFSSAAFEEEEMRPLAEPCGVSRFLRKPALPESVLSLIDATLGVGPAAAHTIALAENFDREHSRVLLEKLSQKVAELEAANRRLVTLVALGQQLTVAQDVPALLETFCQGARGIVGAEYAAVCMLSDDHQSACQFIASGTDGQATAQVQPRLPCSRLLARLIAAGKPLRLRALDGEELEPGLVLGQSGIRSFLGTPIRSGSLVYGLLYLVNKANAHEFSLADEDILATLAAEIAVAYENALRHDALRTELAERRKAEEHVRRLNAELERRVEERTADLTRSNRELEQFAYVASHDLQEPLRKISGFSQLLADLYRGQLSAEADEFIAYITGGVERMQTLIHDLLAYSRAGRNAGAPSPTDCEAALNNALGNLQATIEASGAVVSHDPLPTVRGDQGGLTQLFQNLVSNAIKYNSAKPPVVHVSASRQGNEWAFAVRDNGIGIAPEFFDRIFVIFQRLHTRQEYPGTGIGLAVCKKIVEHHGGRIWVESQPGQGSTFSFTLPEAAPQPQDRNDD